MSSPHIVHIIPTLAFGGAERFVVNLVNSMTDVRFSIVLLKDHMPLVHDLERRDVDVMVVEKQGKVSPGLFSALEERLAALKPDLVHTHLFGGDFWGRVAADRCGIPVLTTAHNVEHNESHFKRSIKQWLAHRSVKYTTPSYAVKDFLIAAYGIPYETIVVTPFGIDLETFLPVPARSQKDTPHRFVMLGRLTEQKGQDLALQALATLELDIPWQLEIIGEGEDRARLRALAKTLGVDARVQFLPPTYDVAAALERNQTLLMPSRWEGLGLVIMEAMAAGRLVIASHVDGIPEVVDDEETGYLCTPNDIAGLRDTIRYSLEHPAQSDALVRAAKAHARREFGFDKTVRSYRKIYQEILSAHSAGTTQRPV